MTKHEAARLVLSRDEKGDSHICDGIRCRECFDCLSEHWGEHVPNEVGAKVVKALAEAFLVSHPEEAAS